jgi:hypothetical protein
MQRLSRKGTGPPSLLYDTCSFANSSTLLCVAMTARLEVAEKAHDEEKSCSASCRSVSY